MDLDTIFSRLRPTSQFGYYKQRRRKPAIQKTGGLFKGDALQVMRQFPSAQFRVIVTSPPYNLRNSSGHGLRDGRGGKWHNAALLQGYDQHADCMSHDDYVAWQRLCLAEMMRLLRQDGAIFTTINGVFKMAYCKTGMTLCHHFRYVKLSSGNGLAGSISILDISCQITRSSI